MILVVSPAKNLDYDTAPVTDQFTQPDMLEHAAELATVCKKLAPQDLSSLMKISDKLAQLNAARFGDWQPDFTQDNAKQAVLAFNGDVYTGLDATSFTSEMFAYAQSHLRILSGLYGVLRPLDLMMPYRLEMGTKLENPRGKNLYEFWGSHISEKLNESLERENTKTLLNLASNEYFKAVDKKALNADIITPVFKDCKNGQYKVISFYAKKARGLMARFVIERQITDVDALKTFDVDGYYYSEEATKKANEPVFLREEQS